MPMMSIPALMESAKLARLAIERKRGRRDFNFLAFKHSALTHGVSVTSDEKIRGFVRSSFRNYVRPAHLQKLGVKGAESLTLERRGGGQRKDPAI